MSAWFRSISFLAAFVASTSSALACLELALGIARHCSARLHHVAQRALRSSMSLIVCTTRCSSTGREVETAKRRQQRGRAEGERVSDDARGARDWARGTQRRHLARGIESERSTAKKRVRSDPRLG